ncbi:uncharacterized protein LOC128211437 isoform X2 [Mya arenaria]|uniref:uncharacterized protein LOC128211437 isoform X2 n=1 Tax=Mya arenaria TaxID=6604 RepID=UPI0022E48317|nr:uncharacterized protein LOC128211437 isoform X2 [Mya arenaria]XP_052772191.1 uncharacterized protein LOC128211437 isoform X2 [Mya arenaria]
MVQYGTQIVWRVKTTLEINVEHYQRTCTILWRGRAKRKGEDIIGEFLTNFSETNITFVEEELSQSYTNLVCKFIFDENGNINHQYDHFLKRQIDRKRKAICPFYSLVHQDGRIVLYGKAGSVDILKKVIQESVSKHSLKKTLFEERDVLKFLEKHKEKFWYDTRSGTLLCTKDLTSAVIRICKSRLLSQRLEVKIEPELLVTFLQRNGGDLMELAKRHGFDILFDGKDIILESSLNDNCKEIQSALQKAVADRRIIIPVDLPFNETIEHIQTIMDKIQCSWCLHCNNPKAVIVSKDLCKSWIDPFGSTKIWVTEMGTDIPCTDLGIVLTADMIRHLGISNCNTVEDSSKTSNEGCRQKETFYGPFPVSYTCVSCREIHLTGVKVTQNERLVDTFIKEITLSRDKGCRSLCVFATIGEREEEPASGEIISQFVNAVREVVHQQRPTFTQNVYIVVDKSHIVEAKEQVELSLSQTFNVFRQAKYQAEKNCAGRTITVTLVEESITKSASDAIVSTTSGNLDLSKGSANIEIVRADGQELQNEYEVFYPKGIEKGIIAFCKTHRLRKENVKYILLGVLDDYSFKSFQVNVNTFVKSCLILAEELQCKSVSLPVIGVETLKYPRRETIAFVLDAIDEYSLEVKDSDITKVNIVCAKNDRKTIDAFNAEKWRRSKGFNVSPEKGPTAFKGQTLVSSNFHSTKVTLVSACEYSLWPSFAVQVMFSKELKGRNARNKEFKLKKAMVDPATWNDELHFKTIESLKKECIINELKGVLNDERITFLIWKLDSKSRMSYSDQIVLTVSSLETMLKPRNCCLQNVVLLLEDSSAIQHLYTRIHDDSTISWKLIFEETASESLEIIGKTPECALKAKKEVLQLIAETKNSIESSQNGQKSPNEVEESQTNDTEDYVNSCFHDLAISSTLNAGIVRFLGEGLTRWACVVRETFNVTLDLSNSESVTVSGDLKNILSFETYLHTGFPNNPLSASD